MLKSIPEVVNQALHLNVYGKVTLKIFWQNQHKRPKDNSRRICMLLYYYIIMVMNN